MATIIKASERQFEPVPNRTDGFRLFTDVSRAKNGVVPEWLNFDVRKLDPGEWSAPYHFHRYAEEMFLILTGRATLRTEEGLAEVAAGDIMFFEPGLSGAHQLHNHTGEECTFLDVRTSIGYDVCEYPDSDKILLAPTMEIFDRGAQMKYSDRENDIRTKWKTLERSGK